MKQWPFILIILVIVAGGAFYIWQSSPKGGMQQGCTLEAKICPDGSTVGRVGPDCEFAACPGESTSTTQALETYSDKSKGVSFDYPPKIEAKYIQTVDWPPQVSVQNGPFTCTEAGSETAQAGVTKKQTINGTTYCITKESEGAAGSIYTQYAYAFPKADKVAILTFSLRFPQCPNYEDPQKTECQNEEGTFTIDGIIDQMASSLTLTPVSVQSGSGVRGSVLLGPTCPVMRNPPDPQCADKPYQTSLALTSADGTRVIKTFSSDVQGIFSIQVPPGSYAIRSAATSGMLPRCSSSEPIEVKVSVMTEAKVYCDTGIR